VIETKEYRISRSQIAYWTAFEYIRRFWPAFISFPIMGVIILIFLPVQQMKAVGMLMLLWPFSIPARAILITGKAAKRALRPKKMICEGQHLYFLVDPIDFNYRYHIDSIRDVKARVEYVVIEKWHQKLDFVPYAAFQSPEQVQEFRRFCGVIPSDNPAS
jgi:hypothetical protein